MLARRTPFFYGWVLVGLSLVSGAFSTGLIVWGMGIFIPPMQEELGWSRTTFFLPLAIGGLVSALLGPTIGPFLDRKHGPQTFFLVGSIISGLTVMYLREVDGLLGYLLVFGVVGGIGRYLAQMVALVIPKWFVRRRGVAQATHLAGLLGGGPLVFPVILQALIGAVGWRDTWFIMGLALIAVTVPLSLLIIRSPEDVGLLPDGDLPDSARVESGRGRSAATEVSLTRGEALRTRLFWLVVVAVSTGMMAIRGMIPNFVPFFVARGLSPSLAAASVTVYAAVAIPAGFIWGHLGDRLGHRRPFMAACGLVATALLFIALVRTPTMMFIAMSYLGLVLAGFWILNMLLVANSFGRQHIGAIRGAMQPFNNAAMFGGPVAFGALYDLSGGYGWLFAMAAITFLGSATAAYFIRWPGTVPAREASARAG